MADDVITGSDHMDHTDYHISQTQHGQSDTNIISLEKNDFHCPVCNISFTDKEAWHIHLERHGPDPPTSTCSGLKRRESIVDSFLVSGLLRACAEGEVAYKCTACGMAFSKNAKISAHMKRHLGDKPHQCSICNNTFAKAYNLALHMRTHTKEKPFTCHVCSRSFCSSGGLQIHTRTHTGEKPFSCDLCSSRFGDQTRLRRHRETHAPREKTYQCAVCDKAFYVYGKLTRHMKSHTGERAWRCTQCDKSFPECSQLTAHMKTHTTDKQYQCTVCDKTFTLRHYLIKHMVTHSDEKPYECTVCGQRFTHSWTLATHARVHTGERPYSCHLCHKTFTQNGNLLTHLKIHTASRNHVCTLCNKTFIQKGGLKRHMENIHPREVESDKTHPKSKLHDNIHIEPIYGKAYSDGMLNGVESNVDPPREHCEDLTTEEPYVVVPIEGECDTNFDKGQCGADFKQERISTEPDGKQVDVKLKKEQDGIGREEGDKQGAEETASY